ncbi:NAD+ nucleosidase [Fasciola hepatica]|uniref:NAD+ nucleosidase n=1 Tax=Fasciola hepatica TaxID=6192 RepID=A0A4E0RBS7_FASHE|nr:NAD+ nucleosidase [Fasciola hepatica]
MKYTGTGTLMLLVLSLFVACSFGQQTSDFEKITKGRCATWGRMFGVDRITCDQIWADFEKVFTGEPIKKLCVMDPQLYDPLVASMFALVPEISKNGFFWSKTKAVTTALCGKLGLFTCLESTLPGFMFNDLDWCDEKLTGGKKYETQCGCTGKAEVVYAFWKSVSNAYSNKLSGSVGVMLNGSIPTPFSRNSTFGSVEVPNIKAPRFQNVTVYVLKNLEDDNLRANCFSESIVQLQTILKDQKVDYKCVDDPPFVKHFMCVQNPDHPRCAFSSSRWTSTSSLLILLSFFSSHIF